MPESAALHLEFERSRNFFTNPKSYVPFDLTRDRKRIVSCIDPRDEHRDSVKTTVQTAGGAVGEGVDAAITMSIMREEVTSIETGLASDRNLRKTTLPGAHHNCAFVGELPVILEEETDPSSFTLDALIRWANLYQVRDVIDTNLSRVKDAAALQQNLVQQRGTESLVEFVDELYPDHPNVTEVIGENQARIYVVNHHPYVGLNRAALHREESLSVQGYHDSLRAVTDDLNNTLGLKPEVRGIRLTAAMLRSAAVRTILGGMHSDTEYYEVVVTDRGPQVEQQEAA